MSDDDGDALTYAVYSPSIFERFVSGAGWALGWACYWLARTGNSGLADRLVDRAVRFRRGNSGAIRAVGLINAQLGLQALRRGRLLIEGQVVDLGPFANRGFFATYDIATRSPERALKLIERWEWDALPGSLRIVEGELDSPDPGAEGILWVSDGRIFFADE